MRSPRPPLKSSSSLSWILPLLAVALVLLAVGGFLLWQQRGHLQPPTPEGQDLAWQVAFTEPRYPDTPAARGPGIDRHLVDLMDRADRTIDVAIYDFDLASVADALARAAHRGVRVRMVTDADTVEDTRNQEIQAALQTVRDADIPIVPDSRGAIMHHKFTVVDNEWVQTGSWNYTTGDTFRLNNNQAIFHSPELARNFTAEFEKMQANAQFGPSKARGVPVPLVELPGGMRIHTYFSPQDRPAEHIARLVQDARSQVRFMAFSFTHDPIGDAMIARHRAGVSVQGVFENTGSNTQFSEFGRLREAGIQVYQDGNPYVMHHKVILLDNRVTIFGSFNFSENANTANDENLLIVEDPAFNARFQQEYDRVLATATNPPPRK